VCVGLTPPLAFDSAAGRQRNSFDWFVPSYEHYPPTQRSPRCFFLPPNSARKITSLPLLPFSTVDGISPKSSSYFFFPAEFPTRPLPGPFSDALPFRVAADVPRNLTLEIPPLSVISRLISTMPRGRRKVSPSCP